MSGIEFKVVRSVGSEALLGRMPINEAPLGYITVSSESGNRAPEDVENEVLRIGLFANAETEGIYLTVQGRKGLNDWYEENVGYRPDEDGPDLLDINELLSGTAEMMFYHRVTTTKEIQMNAPVTTPAAKEKVAPTYLTARFADGNKDGVAYKNVTNLFFKGGLDKRGLPVFSNREENTLALVDKSGAKLDLFETDDKGDILANADGSKKQAFLRVNLDRFVQEGVGSKGLEVGQGSVTGPAAAQIVGLFKETIANKPAKPAAAASTPTP